MKTCVASFLILVASISAWGNATKYQITRAQPAFSPAIVVKTERTRIKWTISNYNYVLTLHLLNCPAQFKAQKCEVQIPGMKSYPDPIWAHYAMPENRREVKLWFGTLYY